MSGASLRTIFAARPLDEREDLFLFAALGRAPQEGPSPAPSRGGRGPRPCRDSRGSPRFPTPWRGVWRAYTARVRGAPRAVRAPPRTMADSAPSTADAPHTIADSPTITVDPRVPLALSLGLRRTLLPLQRHSPPSLADAPREVGTSLPLRRPPPPSTADAPRKVSASLAVQRPSLAFRRPSLAPRRTSVDASGARRFQARSAAQGSISVHLARSSAVPIDGAVMASRQLAPLEHDRPDNWTVTGW